MAVIVGIFIGCALFITMGFTLFTDVKLWGVAREGFRAMRQVPPEQRRRTYVMMATTYLGSAAYVLFLAIAPFGRRDTMIWFLIVPFLVLAPLGMIAAGIRSYRLGRHQTLGDSYVHPKRPKGERTAYKYGGSLGWIASMIDPETSSWKAARRPKPERDLTDRDEPETSDDSSL